MSYDQYWYDDPMMVRAFYKAEKIRQEQIDTNAWLQGIYIANAIESTIGNAFLGKGKQPHKYPKEPFLMSKETDAGKTEATDIDAQVSFARGYMLQFCEAGKNWGK